MTTGAANFLLGVAAAAVGFGLKAGWDLLTERRARTRHDAIWRRERYVEAAADLLQSSWELSGANARVVRAVASLSVAESGGNASIIQTYRDEWRAAVEEHWPLPAKANHQLQLIRLYAPDAVVADAEALVDASNARTSDPLRLDEVWVAAESARDVFRGSVIRSLQPDAALRPQWWPGKPWGRRHVAAGDSPRA